MDYRSTVMADRPSAYWRLGEASGTDAFDSSGNGLTGVYVGTPTLGVTGAIAGDPNKAVTLNGTTQYLTVADNDLLDPGDVFTLECWIKRTAGTSGRIFSKGTNGYELTNENGPIYFLKSDGAVLNISTVSAPVGIYAHVVAAKSGAAINLYLNGADVTGAVTNATIVATTTQLNIGRYHGGGNAYAGDLDEVAIYPTALSPARVLAHYRTGLLGGTIGQSYAAIHTRSRR